ncbi:metallophosphoesterase [Paenibacillus sp. 1P07SE]|uniref:metallophosphoesterase n=1 Tax=Paenibacillus sp. 1P07SE TaxID=3132209 RepID=UPI0039A74A71
MWWLLGAAAAAAILMVAWMIKEAFGCRVVVEEVRLDRLPESFDGLRLFFISDIHRRTIPQRLVEQAAEAGGADLVCIGGDLREGGVPLERIRHNIRTLSRIAPVYAVYGNHDYDQSRVELDKLLHEEGCTTLVNEHILLKRPEGSMIKLCGLDDPITERARLAQALKRGEARDESGLFTLLLSHDPNILDRLEGAPVDLILSGHTHAGQITLPVYGPLLRSPEILTYLRGWYTLEDAPGVVKPRLYVSAGFGTSKLPIRLGAPAEAKLLILRQRDGREA